MTSILDPLLKDQSSFVVLSHVSDLGLVVTAFLPIVLFHPDGSLVTGASYLRLPRVRHSLPRERNRGDVSSPRATARPVVDSLEP